MSKQSKKLWAERKKNAAIVDRLKGNQKPKESKQDYVLGSQVQAAIPTFERLFALPEIVRDSSRLLNRGWTHPDFSTVQLSAAAKALSAHASRSLRAMIAARWFVSIETGSSFDTVGVHHRQFKKSLGLTGS